MSKFRLFLISGIFLIIKGKGFKQRKKNKNDRISVDITIYFSHILTHWEEFKMSKLQSYAAGFIVGALAGSLAVLLSTPKSGKELRNDFSDVRIRLKTTANELKRDTIELKNNIVKLSAVGKETIKTIGSDLKTDVINWKEEVDPSIQTLKADIEALKAKAEQAAIEIRKTK
ncbi:hypothetical protein DCC39_09340 [Pueribacillus theae]|uniref:YtxH domain-containing protein n=2 Tax=Pueribacillus theae TaxID=2171751 RepID=A0A2U1K2S8_9BACI|nr:hypothetical protein DCC39_09340 [Pueribacillus theae]